MPIPPPEHPAPIRLEEWERLRIGTGPLELHPQAFGRLVLDWQLLTHTDPGNYFEFGPGWLKPKNWVGTVLAGGRSIEVAPRGSRELSEADRQRLDRNLGQMLETVAGELVPLSSAQLSGEGTRYERAVDGLCELILAARRTRTLRDYAVREEISHGYRGRLKFPQHSLLEIRRPGYFHTTWAELHQDVPVNRFLRAALEAAYARTSGRIRRRIESVLVDFDGVGAANPWAEFRRIDTQRVPQPYLAAINMARALLDGRLPGLYAGSFSAPSEVLLMPSLFERFVTRLLGEASRSLGMRAVIKQGNRYLAQWESGPFAGRQLVELIPDVEVLGAGPERQTILIVDAKWKHLAPNKPGLSIEAADVHQMMAYGVGLNCDQALLIYPWVGTNPPITLSMMMRVGRSPAAVRVIVSWLPLLWDRVEEAAATVRRQVQSLAA